MVVTLDDIALNVDPTGEDTWYFTTDPDVGPFYKEPTNFANIAIYAQAAFDRDSDIEDAQAEFDRATSDPRGERIATIAKAQADFDTIDIPARAALEDPFIDTARESRIETTLANAELVYYGIVGRGGNVDEPALTYIDGIVETINGVEMNVPDSVPDNWRGTAWITYDLASADADTEGSPAAMLDAAIVVANEGYTSDTTADLPAATASISGALQTLNIDTNDVLECATTDCAVNDDSTTDNIDPVIWVKFTEDGSNESTFTNVDGNDDASLKTSDGAQRGLSFSVSYDNTATSGIGFSTTNIVIDAGAEWNSGEEIAITLTDSDANTNSLTEDDLSITDPDHIIPTIKIGDPFTLGSIAERNAVAVANATASDPPVNGGVVYAVTPVSDILVLGTGGYAAVGEDTDNNPLPAKLNIALGLWSEVNDYLPQYEPSFRGTHMINYDISEIGGTSIDLVIGNNPPISLVNGTAGDSDSGTKVLTGPDFDTETDTTGFAALYDEDGNIKDFGENRASLEISLPITAGTINAGDSIVIDIFSFGLEDLTDDVNNAIYRLELAEDGSNSSDFTGTLEYVGLNQINVLDEGTYAGIDTSGDSIILISDNDSISVEYLDLDSTGGETLFTAEADTPTHSGSVSLDSDGYKVADTVTITVEDADLNVDSERTDVYTTVADDSGLATSDSVGSDLAHVGDLVYSTGGVFGELLTVSFDGKQWVANQDCALGGLDASQFTLRETGSSTGIFTGTFAVPAEYCDGDTPTSITGADISVEYVDFRDDSGSLISVSASVGIRSTTGSVSLDRTVYPVPFGADDLDDPNDEAFFATHNNPLPQGDLTVYVDISDADFDTSSNGIDSIEVEGSAPLTVSIIRGSDEMVISMAGNTTTPIDETGPDTGIFGHSVDIAYNNGPDSTKCPASTDGCILQGDILHVQYSDPSDASGSDNTVTDSATFDLRNGVLQSDQTAYIIGSGMIVTLIEPDLNLDSDATETYTLDLIEWDSDAGTCTLAGNGGDCVGISNPFDPTPSNLLETGLNTGIFQVVVGIPPDIDGDRLERGEEITLTYIDNGPSGADHVGDKDEEITTTVYTSNFGATIELDQRVYTWTDKVYVTVVAPDHNIDSDQVDEIGNTDEYPIRVSTRGNEIEEYKLVETGADTGIFTGEIILTGFPHDADGDGQPNDADGNTSGTGPTDGQIRAESESGISVSFKYSDGETVSSSALIRWNVGEVQWLEASYPASGSGIVRVIDPDMNLNPEAVDNFDVTVWSDSDGGGIDLTVTETNAATGIFEGTVFFGVGVDTSGHRLRVVEGDTVTAQYYDNTLPAPFKETERVRVGATTLIGTIVPPLERAPISDLRAVDSFGNTLDVISVDSQIQLAADLTNNQDKEQKFAYLIQIQDENGVTVSLDWIAGSLTEGQSLSPASSWTPTESGTYEVTAFVWESIENPTALSPTATIAITVN